MMLQKQYDGEVWYRAYSKVHSSQAVFDSYDGEFSHFVRVANPKVDIRFDEYPVLRHTPQGVWLEVPDGWQAYGTRVRFVLREARKRFACPTKEEAVESLLARQRRRAGILASQLADVQSTIKHISEEKARDEGNID